MEQEKWQFDNSGRYEQPEHPPRKKILQAFFAKDRRRLQLVLFILTFFSTYHVGGASYAVAIMSILLAHEMGHYVMCKYHGIPATLPFFIPMPFTIFGTMGAVIAMKSHIPNRRALFDVGVAGPLAGLVLALPAIAIGLRYSTIEPNMTGYSGLSLGEPLIFLLIKFIVIGPIPEGMDVFVHPLAFAGWVGLFVTALNLMPIGQLDGGHIAYALFGKKSKYIYFATLIVFAISTYLFPYWIPMLFLLVFFFFKHPPPLDDVTRIDRKRRILGILMFVIFIISFTPVPFEF